MATLPRRLRLGLGAALVALAIAAGWWAWQSSAPPKDRPALGLMTSLPIYWPEDADIALMIDGSGETPWVRAQLEQDYEVIPLDTLAPPEGAAEGAQGPLVGMERMLLVQPRAVGSADNVAVDQWVRDGGRLLYVLDPMLTGQYAVPWGDPAHPIVTALIPPIFTRWGLGVQFTEAQPFELRQADFGLGQLPVLMAGEFVLQPPADGASAEDLAARGECELLGQGLVARCQVGNGRVTAVADATLFEFAEPNSEIEAQLDRLIELAFE